MYQRLFFNKDTKLSKLTESQQNPSVDPSDQTAHPPPDVQQAPKTTHEMDKKLKRRGKYIKIRIPKE